jgi:hypothetical protein
MDGIIERLYQELAQGAQILSALASGITEEEARFKPSPESRSVLEVVAHVLDEEREDFRPRLDITLYHLGTQWSPIDPDGWVTKRGYNDLDFEATLQAFLAERQKSLDWLKDLVNPDWEARYQAPSGSISAGDLLACWAAHDNLHMRQLVELRRRRLERIASPYDLSYAGEW